MPPFHKKMESFADLRNQVGTETTLIVEARWFGVEPAELREVAEGGEVFLVHLRLIPSRPSWEESGCEMNEWSSITATFQLNKSLNK